MKFHNKKKKSSRGRAKWHALMTIIAVLMVVGTGCSVGFGQNSRKNWEKNIAQETVQVEGLEGEYTLLFLTDTHVVIKDSEVSAQEAEDQESRYPMFVNAEGVPAEEQFPEWIQYANEKKVDAVLLGGDIIDSPSEANLQWLKEQLEVLDMPYLYINGNHDWTYPWEYMTDMGRERYLPLLEPFMQGNTAFQRLNLGGLVILGIDDSTNQVDAQALDRYREALMDNRPVIVMAHVPFMTQSALSKAVEAWNSPVVIGAGNFGGIYPNEESEKFISLTTAADSPVELVLAGHVHFYDRDVIEGEKNVPQVVGAAGYQGNAVLIHITGTEN